MRGKWLEMQLEKKADLKVGTETHALLYVNSPRTK